MQVEQRRMNFVEKLKQETKDKNEENEVDESGPAVGGKKAKILDGGKLKLQDCYDKLAARDREEGKSDFNYSSGYWEGKINMYVQEYGENDGQPFLMISDSQTKTDDINFICAYAHSKGTGSIKYIFVSRGDAVGPVPI